MKTPPVKEVTSHTVTVGAMVSLPFDVVGDSRKNWLRDQLTVIPKKQSITFGPKLKDAEGNLIDVSPEPIVLYQIDHAQRRVSVPFSWGMKFIGSNYSIGDGVRFAYAEGMDTDGLAWCPVRFPDPGHENAAAGQEQFFADILTEVRIAGSVLIQAPTGNGKCLGAGTPVLLYGGEVIPAESVMLGDLLTGPDGTPRKVTGITSGKEMLYTVRQKGADDYVVNESHILSTRITNTGKAWNFRGLRPDGLLNIPVTGYLQESKTFRHMVKGWMPDLVRFSDKPVGWLPPYALGLWLGDGHSRCFSITSVDEVLVSYFYELVESRCGQWVRKGKLGTTEDICYFAVSKGGRGDNKFLTFLKDHDLICNKHIPFSYRTASVADRLELLAGVIDTDGSLSCGCYDLTLRSARLMEDILFVARSCGFRANRRKTKVIKGVSYYRCGICGDISRIPCKLPHKQAFDREQVKNWRRWGITVEPKGIGDYYGFTLEGPDRLFLLGDMTVTHNTVALLNTIGKLGRTALVIVPSKALADQWLQEAMLHLGLERGEIGIIKGPMAPWKGKRLVIAVIHNLFLKEYEDSFYQYFGTVIWDEAHRLGAPEFCKTMPLFPARYRIGATATPDRKDGCMDVVTSHLGDVAVRMEGNALPCECRVIEYHNPFAYKIAALPPPIILKILTKNKDRNTMAADAILRMYRLGRNVLVLSDRVEHLQTMQLLLTKEVPKESIGLFVGHFKVNGKTKQTGEGYLRDIRENPKYRVILATYAMFKEGVSIARLDGGIDITPRADGEQAIGRVRRPLPNKKLPVWFTIIDKGIPILEAYAKARIRDYQQCGVTVI